MAVFGTAIVPRNSASGVPWYPRRRCRLQSEVGEEMGALNTHEEREREIEALRASISRLSAANLRFSKSPDLEPSRKRRWNPFARGPLNSASGGQGRGVVWVATLQRGVAHLGGARFGPPQRFSLRGRSPRCCGRGLAWKALWDAGWHGFPASAATTVAGRCPACPRVGRCAAPGGRGSGGSDPLVFGAGAPPGRGDGARQSSPFPPPFLGSLPPQ